MAELSEAMLKELRHLGRMPAQRSENLSWAPAEALRRRGLVDRYTTYVVGADYARFDGEFEQFRSEQPRRHHEWFLTEAGRAALRSPRDDG